MSTIRHLRKRAGLTQRELASRAGTSQPTIAAYESGTKTPGIQTLRRIAEAMGVEAAFRVVPPLTREDRRSLALHRAIAVRLRADPAVVKERARRNLDRMQSQSPGEGRLFAEWRQIIERPTEGIVEVLDDPAATARELRQVTPFAGVLSAAERTRILREFADEESRR